MCGLKAVSDDGTWAVWAALVTLVVGGGWLTFRVAGRYRVLALLVYAVAIGFALYKA